MIQARESQERRLHRFTSTLPAQVTIGKRDKAVEMKLVNVSPAGLRLSSPLRFAAGDRLEIKVPMADPFHATAAEVVWCIPGRSWQFDLGVKFLVEPSMPDDRLYAQLREIEIYRQTVRDFEGRAISSEEAAEEWREPLSDDFDEQTAG